ncbi:MAG TPA: glycosyltransferase family 39 protein [Candidatus Obscuribacterales bacterium]
MNHKIKSFLTLETGLVLAIIIGIILRLTNLGSREYWYDEVLSLLLFTGQKIYYQAPTETPVLLANYNQLLSLPSESNLTDFIQTLINLFRGIVGGEPHPLLFFITQHFWLRLLGNSEIATRSLNVIFSIAAIGCSYGLGRFYLGHRGGLLLTALVATNPFYLFHSLNLRMYTSLLLWTILSAWSLLKIIDQTENNLTRSQKIFWNLLLIISVAAGCLTFYLFAYWVITLAVVVLYLDRRKWWQHAIRLGSGVLITIPWVLWGTRQQLRNADFGRFNSPTGFLATLLQHFKDVVNTLGNQLLIGDWSTNLPDNMITVTGCIILAGLIFVTIYAGKTENKKAVITTLIFAFFPLLLALLIDIKSGKFTVGFGAGRSLIFILPGCLLLITTWIEKSAGRWRNLLATALLGLYLTINIADFSIRNRQMFHQLSDIISTQPTTPTLIVMNSKAWGHVNRLAYYISPEYPVFLLAQESNKLSPALQKSLTPKPSVYGRIILLEAAEPIWSEPTTQAERETIQGILKPEYQLKKNQLLQGTMDLDEFNLKIYERL